MISVRLMPIWVTQSRPVLKREREEMEGIKRRRKGAKEAL